jgi:MFS family permease
MKSKKHENPVNGQADEVAQVRRTSGDGRSAVVRMLGRRASFWVVTAVVAHTLWTSAAPSMTYRLYASEWGLSPAETTAIFAVFPIVVVAVLIFSGDISDYIGRRSTLLIGLSSSLVGTVLFAIAPSVLWVFAGRAFVGLGVGLCAGPAAAALLEFSAAGQETRASSINTLAQAVGLALATIVCGALIQYAPYPTHLNFWVLWVVLAILFAAAWFLPRTVSNKAPGRWQPKLPCIPRGIRKIFAASALAAASGYAIGGLMMSLGAQIAHDLVGSDNAFVNGVAIALFAVAAGVVAVPGKRLTPRAAIKVGGASAIAGAALLALSTARHSLPIFVAAATAGGIGFCLMYSSGLSLINANAPADRRGGVLSALYLVAFAMQAVIVLLLGATAMTWGLGVAVDLGAVAIAVLSICTIGLAVDRNDQAVGGGPSCPVV